MLVFFSVFVLLYSSWNCQVEIVFKIKDLRLKLEEIEAVAKAEHLLKNFLLLEQKKERGKMLKKKERGKMLKRKKEERCWKERKRKDVELLCS